MLQSFVVFSVAFLTFGSALFLVRGALGLSPEQIAELVTMRVGYNREVIRDLARQQADAGVGFVMLLFAFALQIGNSLNPTTWADFEISFAGLGAALALFLITSGIGFVAARRRADRVAAAAEAIWKERHS
jgi:hypothetical protein